MKINENSQLGIRILSDKRLQSMFLIKAYQAITKKYEQKLERGEEVDGELIKQIQEATDELKEGYKVSERMEELSSESEEVQERAALVAKTLSKHEDVEIATKVFSDLERLRKKWEELLDEEDEYIEQMFRLIQPLSDYADAERSIKEHFFPKATKWFLIQDSALHASKLVKIDSGYTARSVKDINLGHYTYLLGKHTYLHFYVGVGKMNGYYYDDERDIYFEFKFDLDTGACEKNVQEHDEEFVRMLQILTYVELAEVEVTIVPPGKTNNKDKKDGKVLNDHKYDVYVVDSSWNKMIIRDSDFAVSGHFRLQPCGPGWVDRKLIWVDPFIKHGYRRKPKATIIKG